MYKRQLKSFGVDSRLEEFEIDTWRILKAEFTVTEPFEKTYTVAGYGRCGSTPADGIEAPFLYADVYKRQGQKPIGGGPSQDTGI